MDTLRSTAPADAVFLFVHHSSSEVGPAAAHRKSYLFNNSEKKIEVEYQEEKPLPRIWSLFADLENRIWIGKVGISFLENGSIHTFDQYNEFSELADALVLFYKDKNRIIWVGSNKGVYQLDSQKGIIARYGKDRPDAFQLPSNKFQDMCTKTIRTSFG